MQGIVHLGGGEVVVTDELEVRGPGPTEVTVKLAAAGVCHSDLSVLDGTIPFPTPVVCGHGPGTTVEDSNLPVQIAALRRVLDAGGDGGSAISTVPGRGYRFTLPVRREEDVDIAASLGNVKNST